ncbi:MAG: twin-arginine translocase subunit TatC [Candidatus Nanopelagicales bacterium]
MLAINGVTDAFTLQLQVVIVPASSSRAPIWLYQLWRFLVPGLKGNERSAGRTASSSPRRRCSSFGAAIAYRTMPNLLALLLGSRPRTSRTSSTCDTYLGFTIQIMAFFGIGALIPLIFVMLNFAGVLSRRPAAARHWRWLVIGVPDLRRRGHPDARPVRR